MDLQALLINANIALAAYADIGLGGLASQDAQLKQEGFASGQSAWFADLFTVVLPTYHDPSSDLDVTGFKDASGNLTLGIRGTLPGHDLTVTDAQIALNGAGYDQIVALYNWWQRVSNPAGSSVSQFVLTDYPNGAAPAGAVKLFDTSLAFGGRSMYLVAAPSAMSTGELTAALAADPDHKIDVTGHSLGGHLALAFNALFPSSVGQAVGFDTPGFLNNTVNQQFFSALGGAVPTSANSGNFISVIADEAAIGEKPFNAIAGVWSRPGVAVDIGIENQWLSDEPVPEVDTRNHSMKMLADSLATYNLLHILDPSLSTITYKQLLSGASNGSAASYERIVDWLETSFNVNQTWLSTGNGERDAFYSALHRLRDGSVLQSLAGKVTLELASAGNLATQAKTDFAAFLSLQTLSPIVLRTDTTGQAILKQANKTLAQQWEADRALLLEQRNAGLENYTDVYLLDRQAMLQGLIAHNIADKSYDTLLQGKVLTNYTYTDFASGQILKFKGTAANASAQEAQQVMFGNDLDNGLLGSNAVAFGLGDRLYGGAGNDYINGGAGEDYLEGNAGNDNLQGGEGNDTLLGGAHNDSLDGGTGHDELLGGAGDDTLAGGEGHDMLAGGAGEDRYYFEGNIGLDIIRDSDGRGKIVVGAPGFEPLSGGKKLADNAWISDNMQFTYTLVDGNLVIRPAAGSGASGTFTVKDWTNGQLGITLSDTPAPLPPTTSSYIGDFAKKTNPEGTQYVLGEDGQYVADGAQANALDLITGTGGADLIQGLGGDDALLGGGGADIIEGGEGNDVLMGGLGADVLKGGAGLDLIYGSSTGTLQYPLTNFPVLDVSFPIVLGKGFNWKHTSPGLDDDGFQQSFISNNVGRDTQANDAGNTIEGGAGDDIIYAGTGNDVVHGGHDRDQIWGMAGADVLFGDEGDDRIYGDGSATNTVTLVYTPASEHGDDVLIGGMGNDLLIGQGGGDALYGGIGSDQLYGDDRDNASLSGDDYLDGGGENDALFGGAGNDILIGGLGNDSLKGGAGRDVYFFNRGDGQDTVFDDGEKNNVFRFGAGINQSDVTLRLGSLMLDLGNGDQIHIEGFNQADASNSVAISSFEFADGSVLSTDELLSLGFDIDGTEGDDILRGTSVDDRIHGLGGNDVLHALSGSNLLDGGDGDDHLVAGDGEDTLVGGAGRNAYFLHEQGTRTVVQASGDLDIVVLAAGVKLIDVISGSADAEGLTLTLVNGQQLVVQGQAKYQFTEGTYSQAQVAAFIGSLAGASNTATEGNDIVYGQATDDYLFAGDGDDVVVGAAGDDRLFGQSGHDMVAGGLGADSIAGGGGNDTLHGDAGSDKLWGQAGDDSLYGGSGADELTGGDGNDLFAGGTGDDLLIAGGSGAKTYLFELGDGRDIILPGTGTGNVKFGTGIVPADIKLYASPANDTQPYVRIEYSAQDSVVIRQGSGNGALAYQFADGSVMTHAALVSMAKQAGSAPYSVIGTEGADDLWAGNRATELNGAGGDDGLSGSDFNDALRGGSGDDTLTASSGNDLLEGGSGNDALYGGSGSDTYLYARGDGNDIIDEDNGSADINALRFADLSASDLTYSREASGSLLIRINGSGGSVEIRGWYTDPAKRLQQIIYADGSSADLSALENLSQIRILGTNDADALVGTQYADIIEGLAGDDSIDGGLGSDLLIGGDGADTYVMRRGMGIDTIQESAGSANVLKLGTGLGFEEIMEERQGNDIYLYFSRSSQGVVLKDYFAGTGDWLVTLETGQQKTLSEVISENQARARAETAQQLRDEWLVDAKTSLVEMYLYDGRRDGVVQAGPFEVRRDSDWGTSIQGFAETSLASDDTYIERVSWVTQETVSSWTTTYDALLPTTQFHGSGPGGEGSGSPYFEIYDWGNLDAMGEPNHTLLGLVDGEFLSPAQLPDDGVLISPTSALPPGGQYMTVKVKVVADVAYSEVFENITAGASSNFIYSYGMGTVDAGAGDDVVYGESIGRSWGYPGQFMDGGAGDDIVMGSHSDDLILGGAGNDYLMGGQGHDTYHLSADDPGTKIIDEATSTLEVLHPHDGSWTSDGTDKIGTDTVRFGLGIHVADIRVERGTYTSPYAVNWGFHGGQWSYVPDTTVYETLDISWGTGSMARVLVPPVDYLASEEAGGLGVEFFEFADGTRLTTSQFLEMVDGQESNTPPVISRPVLGQNSIEDLAWSFTVPADTFADGDAGDTLTYSASIAGESALPSWLSFDAGTRTFSGIPANADVGGIILELVATDSSGASASATFDMAVTNVNDAPVLARTLNGQEATEDQPWVLTVPLGIFSDVDANDMLSYGATLADGAALPAWLSFDASTRTFSGTPSNGDVGSLDVQVRVTDNAGASAVAAFSLTVVNTNDAPVVTQTVPDQTAIEDEAWNFTVPAATFADVDTGDTLSYSATLADGSELPSWLSFDATTGGFSGIPGNDEVGSLSLKVVAVDSSGTNASTSFNISVVNSNDAPIVADSVGDQSANEDQAWTFTVPAGAFADVDAGDILTYSVSQTYGRPMPAWLSFDAASRTFRGTPLNADVGQLSLTVIATDMAGASASSSFELTVTNVNDAPVVAEVVTNQTAVEDSLWSFSVPAGTFADDDANDALDYSAELADGRPLPSWLSFDSQTRSFSGTPINDDVGQLNLRVIASDLAGATTSVTFNVDVSNVNDAPIGAVGISPQEAVEDQPWMFGVPSGTFVDVDRDDLLTYTARLKGGEDLPTWLEFDSATGRFSGVPSNDHVGIVPVEVVATDAAGASGSVSFALAVQNVNDAPVSVGSLNDWALVSGSSATYALPASAFADVDVGDSLKFSANLGDGSPLPSWLDFDTATGTFSASPTISDGGYTTVVVTAADLAGQSASHTLSLRVDLELAGSIGKDVLTGAAGNDRLDGGTGADQLSGLQGDDTYVVDHRADRVIEVAAEGFDTVQSSVDYVLGSHVEALVLVGTANSLSGTGNDLDNTLTGTAGKNDLYGANGSDTLDGAAGDDVLAGGVEGDVYVFGRGYQDDTIIEDPAAEGTDLVMFGPDIGVEQLWFRKHGNGLEVSIIGTGDSLTVKQWFGSSGATIEQFKTGDGQILLESQVQGLVDAMAAFSPPAAGLTALSPEYQNALGGIIAASWN